MSTVYYQKAQFHFLVKGMEWSSLFYIVPFLTLERRSIFLLTIQKPEFPREKSLSNKLSSFWGKKKKSKH